MAGLRLSKEEVVSRGKDLFRQSIEQRLTPDDVGKYLVIDVDSGDYELGSDYPTLIEHLRTRHHEPALYTMRVGYRDLGRIGGRLQPRSP